MASARPSSSRCASLKFYSTVARAKENFCKTNGPRVLQYIYLMRNLPRVSHMQALEFIFTNMSAICTEQTGQVPCQLRQVDMICLHLSDLVQTLLKFQPTMSVHRPSR